MKICVLKAFAYNVATSLYDPLNPAHRFQVAQAVFTVHENEILNVTDAAALLRKQGQLLIPVREEAICGYELSFGIEALYHLQTSSVPKGRGMTPIPVFEEVSAEEVTSVMSQLSQEPKGGALAQVYAQFKRDVRMQSVQGEGPVEEFPAIRAMFNSTERTEQEPTSETDRPQPPLDQ